MIEISANAKKAMKILFSDYLESYNANNISSKIGTTPMGAKKIFKGLLDKDIVIKQSRTYANIFKINVDSKLTRKLLEFIYSDYSDCSAYVKGWVESLHSFDSLATILFGSLLSKEKKASDVDVCLVIDSKDIPRIQKQKKELERLVDKPIHLLLLTKDAFIEKLKNKDPVLISLVKNAVVVNGEQFFVEVLANVQKDSN